MPTAGKHDSFTEFQAKRVAEQHRYRDVLANQPKWVLRKKAYKPLASGVPDYSIGRGSPPRPTRLMGPHCMTECVY